MQTYTHLPTTQIHTPTKHFIELIIIGYSVYSLPMSFYGNTIQMCQEYFYSFLVYNVT